MTLSVLGVCVASKIAQATAKKKKKCWTGHDFHFSPFFMKGKKSFLHLFQLMKTDTDIPLS